MVWQRPKQLTEGRNRRADFACPLCGKVFVAYIYNVESGHTRSCGCLRRAATRDRSLRHGHKCSDGKTRTRAYAAWVNMRQRCLNPKLRDFDNYGRRGIIYDPNWEHFENFLADMGEPDPGMSLERINNQLDYGPTNCKWATRTEQNLNRRNVKRYEHDGKNLTLGQWATETGIQRITLLKRLQSGMTIEQAVTTPVGKAHVMAVKKGIQ